MNVDILASNDEHFKIVSAKFGEQYVATDGERVAVEPIEELAVEAVKEMQDIAKNVEATTPEPVAPEPPKSNAAPLENSKAGHPFNPFGGTSWDDGKRGHKFD